MKIFREDRDYEDGIRFMVFISNAELASRHYSHEDLLEEIKQGIRAQLEARG